MTASELWRRLQLGALGLRRCATATAATVLRLPEIALIPQMLLERVQIKNFRSFENFDLAVGGDSVILVAPNGGGKTALLMSIGSALSGARGFSQRDFRDIGSPLEIIATLRELDPSDQAVFADAVRFGGGAASLDIGIRAIWDDDAEQLDVTWGYPRRGWTRVGRDARERLPLIWLSAERDPARLIAFVGARSVLEQLINTIDLEQPLDEALTAIEAATNGLVAAQVMSQLLRDLDDALARLIPDVIAGAFDIEPSATTARELLRQFELALSHAGPHIPLDRQSRGLAQLAIFVVALQLMASRPSIVLVDEPEVSLHPQAQRSLLAALRRHASQSIIATHSSSVLSGADPRGIVRLKRDRTDVVPKRPIGISRTDATTLTRYATPETAEAYFARTVVFVEGPSDYLAFREAARVMQVDLDARGVALVSLQGAGLLGTYLTLLGPNGLDLQLRGLCDLDAEADWQSKLSAAGIPVSDRTTMNNRGFFVCDVDLEDELVRAHDAPAVQAIIDQEGETARFNSFSGQPDNRGLPLDEQLTKFARKSKTRWSPRLAAALTAASMPTPLQEVLKRV